MNLKVAAVIVTFNRLKLLKTVVESIRKQTHIPDCIIVVNNGSTDGSKEWLENQSDCIVVNQDNLGATGGFYTGIKKALELNTDKIWILDDDIAPEPNCLEELFKLSSTGCAITAPQRYHGIIPFRPEPLRCNFTNPFKSMWIRHPVDSDYIDGVVKVECGTFEGPLIDAKVFHQVGLPDQDFFIFADDTEFFERCWRKGFPTFITEKAKIQRLIPFDAGKKVVWKRYYELRNLVVLDIRFGNPLVKILRPFGYGLKSTLRSNSLKEIQLVWQGIFDGYRGKLGKKSITF